jgi:hypothetical protein
MEVRRQGNRLGLSSIELQRKKPEQAAALRRSNLYLIRSNRVLDRRLRNWVGVGREFRSHGIGYP